MPIDAIVIPTCEAEMKSLMLSIWCSARAAPRSPSSFIVSNRERRARTSAYSAMTKNAFIATSAAVATSNSAVTRRRRVSRYFEGGRRSRSASGT